MEEATKKVKRGRFAILSILALGLFYYIGTLLSPDVDNLIQAEIDKANVSMTSNSGRIATLQQQLADLIAINEQLQAKITKGLDYLGVSKIVDSPITATKPNLSHTYDCVKVDSDDAFEYSGFEDEFDFLADCGVFAGVNGCYVRKSDQSNCFRK